MRLLGPFAVGHFTSLTGSFATLAQWVPDASDRMLISIVRSGVLEGCHEGSGEDGRGIRAETGDICLFDLSQSERLRINAPACSVLVVPGHVLENATTSLPAEGRVLSSGHPLKRIFIDHIESIVDNFDGLLACEERLVAETTLLLLRGCEPLFFAPHGDVHPKRAAIQRYIDQHLADHDLGTRVLAERFGLSRASLYRIFAPIGGVAEYIRKRRLARVRVEIVASANRHRRITDIAYEWGFNSGAAFSNLFRRTYGVSPRDMRRLHGNRDPDAR